MQACLKNVVINLDKPEDMLRGLTILLVDDDAEVLAYLSLITKRRVKAVITASNGKEGYEKFLGHKPDIVITDINMPTMNGLEMTEKIKNTDHDVPIIVISAYSEQDYFIKAIEIGIDGYVLKPVRAENVLRILVKEANSLYQKREAERLKKIVEDNLRLQSLTQLTKGLSHNFNNLLVGILGYAGLIKMRLSQINDKNITELSEYLETIEQSANKASELISYLLTFSDDANYEKVDIDINNFLKNLLEVIKIPFFENCNITINLCDMLPTVKADLSKLKQAFLNIFLNAKEAMQDKGEFVVETSYNTNGFVTIHVKDNGCGMDEQTKRMAFEPFFTTKGMAKHIGLGLSVALSIIKQHEGIISINSSVTQGTDLIINLPVSNK